MSLPAVLRPTKNLMKKPKTKRDKRVVGKTRREMADDFDGLRHKSDQHTNDGRLVVSDLTVYTNMIHERAKKTFKEIETINSSSLNANDDHYKIPSTPQYSESSFEHLVRYPVNIPRHEDRTFVVILTSLTFFIQMFSRDIWIPLFEPALIAFPKWSQTSLALFPIWNTVVCVFLMSPVCIIINKYGIKTSLLCSCVASTLGACVRCLPYVGDSTFVVHASAVFLSSASVAVRPLTVTISTCCFRTGERNLATGILTSASMAGTAAGLLTTVVLREPSFPLAVPSTSAEWKTVVMWTMYACFAMNVVCSLLVCASFPRESTSPERYESSATAQKFATCVLHIKNTDLLYVVLSYMCSNAFSWPWYQLIDVTYSKMGLPRQVGADCRLWMIVHTCVLTLSVCWFADRSAGSNKCFGSVCLLLSAAFLLWVVWTVNLRHLHGKFPIIPRATFPADLVVGVMFAFPLSWTAQSLQYELVAEHAYPLPENVAIGIAETLKILCECFVYFLMALFPKFHMYWLHVFTLAAAGLSAAFLVLLNGGKRSNRWQTSA